MDRLYIKEKYAFTPKELLDDSKISLEAKGLYGYLQTRPQGWEFSIDDLVFQLKESKETIRKAIKELKDCGYLIVKGDNIII